MAGLPSGGGGLGVAGVQPHSPRMAGLLRVVVGWVWRVFSPIRRAWLASFGWWVGADGWHQAPAEAPALTVELALCDHVTSITYRP